MVYNVPFDLIMLVAVLKIPYVFWIARCHSCSSLFGMSGCGCSSGGGLEGALI